MEQIAVFTIQILDTITLPWRSDEYEDIDPFDEGIFRCFHAHNNHVQISCGDDEMNIELSPDIDIVYNRFPTLLNDIAHSKVCDVNFPESGREIVFTPAADPLVVCTMRKYGYETGESTWYLKKSQVVSEIKSFALRLLERANEGNYITSEEAQNYSNRLDGS